MSNSALRSPTDDSADVQQDVASVWILQPRIEHYRLPVWDGLVEAGAGIYEITAMGRLQHGGSYGGSGREYLREQPQRRFRRLGMTFDAWTDVEARLRAEKPDVVIMSGNPRNLSCWSLPGVCREIGAASVCWSKVHSYSRMPASMMRMIKRRFFCRFDRAICYGKRSFEELIALGYPADHATIAQNTIDTRRIFEDADAIVRRGAELRHEVGMEGRRVLLCIGRMDSDKRHQDLLDAWPRLRERFDDMSMVLVSGGPLLDHIRAEAQRIDPERILVTGRVPEGDDYAWIATSDLTVYPGAVGLAINQSLAFGKPVVIADEFGADSEIIEHDVTGWRYERGDLDALVTTIAQVFEDDATRQRVTSTARERMRSDVTIQNMVRAIDAVIREAIEVSRERKSRKGAA